MSGVNVIFKITDLASATLNNIRTGLSRVAATTTEASRTLFFWREGFNQIGAASREFYDLFIGQNERMRQQILATQSSLSAVQDVYMNGLKLTNPKDAILAFEKPIKESLNNIAIASLDLVGVTSGQLTDLFQITLTNATKITNQSKEFSAPIKAAEKLTVAWAGAFGALQIPLFQSRQEINSILTGTIDMNSRLAKSLSISNEQVRLWSSQGVLVDRLTEKLSPFIAGNALAARSIGGISSNLREILEITTRLAGQQLTNLFIDGLDNIYQFLKQIQPEIQKALDGGVGFIVGGVQKVGEIIEPFMPYLESMRDSVGGIGAAIAQIAGGAIQLILQTVSTFTPLLQPVFFVLGGILSVVNQLLSDPVIQQLAQISLFVFAVIGPLTTVVSLIGTIAGFFASGGGLVTTFIVLSQIAPGLTAMLGAALASIAGIGGTVGTLAASGTGLTLLGGAIATVTAALAPLALAIAAAAAAAMLWQSMRIKDSVEASDTLGIRSNETASQASNVGLQLRQLNDAEVMQDGKLTDEQTAKRKKLISQSQMYAEALQTEIDATKNLKASTEEERIGNEASIAANQKVLDTLNKLTGGLTISAKPLQELGGIFAQNSEKLAAFEKQIKDAADPIEFQKATQGLVGLIQKQVETGQISATEAKARLQQILGDTRVEIAGKEAAQKAITQIQEVESKRQVEASQRAQSEISALQADGRIGDAAAEQEITKAKIKEVQIRLDAQKAAHQERMRQIEAEMVAELDKIDKQVAAQKSTVDKLKSSGASPVEIKKAENTLEELQGRRSDVQTQFVDAQKEENRKTANEEAKLEAEKAKNEKQLRDKQKQERLKDFEEKNKINEAEQVRGLKDNQEAAIASADIAEDRAKEELAQITAKQSKLEAEAKKHNKTLQEYDKEAFEDLQVQRADAQKKLELAEQEAFNKRLADKKQDLQEELALVDAAEAKGDINGNVAAIRTAELTTNSIRDRIKLLDEEIARSSGNKERLEDLNAQKANNEKELTEVVKQEIQKRTAYVQKKTDQGLAGVSADEAMGNLTADESAQKSLQIQENGERQKLKIVKDKIDKMIAEEKRGVKINKEQLDELKAQESQIQSKISEIRIQAYEKRHNALKASLRKDLAEIETAQNQGDLDNQQAAKATAEATVNGVKDQIRLINEEVAGEQVTLSSGLTFFRRNAGLSEEREKELLTRRAELEKQLTDVGKIEFQKRIQDLQQDAEEYLSVIETTNTLGIADNQKNADDLEQIQTESLKKQLELIAQRKSSVGSRNKEALEELTKQEAEAQKKLSEIRKQSFEKRLSDLEQDGQEYQSILEGQFAQNRITESQFNEQRFNQTNLSLDKQLSLIKKRRGDLLATDVEGQEALAAQEAQIYKKRQDTQSQFMEAELQALERANQKASDAIAQAEAERQLITRQSMIDGGSHDAAQDALIAATKNRIDREIELEEQKIATLKALPPFSDPIKEDERQARIRASVKKTTDLRLQLLDEEQKAFNQAIDRQIKAIQNRAREDELSSDATIKGLELQGSQQDLLSRSLENQNKLLQARGQLSNALNSFIQGEYKILQDTAKSESEKKRLIKQAADAQLIALQQQQVLAQKNLEIEMRQAEIAQQRAELEAEIAEIKARAGVTKAQSEVAKAEANLAKVKNDPNASNADIRNAELDIVAARAGVDSAMADVAGAIANRQLTVQKRQTLEESNNRAQETKDIEQATQLRSAQAQADAAIVNPTERRLTQRERAGLLTPAEQERLNNLRQRNQQIEANRLQTQAAIDVSRGVPNTTRQGIEAALRRGANVTSSIQNTVPLAIPNISDILSQVRSQQKAIAPIAPVTNPNIEMWNKQQQQQTGYQKEMVKLLDTIAKKPGSSGNNNTINLSQGVTNKDVDRAFDALLGGVNSQISNILSKGNK